MHEGRTLDNAVWKETMRLFDYLSRKVKKIILVKGNHDSILEPIVNKWESFGWHVIDMNGHDMQEIVSTLEEAKTIKSKPVCIIANTVPGKGVSFMEGKHQWHGKAPNAEEREKALKELKDV